MVNNSPIETRSVTIHKIYGSVVWILYCNSRGKKSTCLFKVLQRLNGFYSRPLCTSVSYLGLRRMMFRIWELVDISYCFVIPLRKKTSGSSQTESVTTKDRVSCYFRKVYVHEKTFSLRSRRTSHSGRT